MNTPSGQPSNSSAALSFKFKPVKSSTLAGYSYDDKAYVLTVAFNNGKVFQYLNVFPNVMSEVFDSGPSIGSKFHRLIKNGGYMSNKLI